MKPAPFDLMRPDTLAEAIGLLAAHGATARVIAGGQSLVPLMNLRMATPGVLIDLGRISGLSTIAVDGDRLVVGAMVRQAVLLDDALIARYAPLLRAAAWHIGHVQTRARGTIGGSLAHADPAAELPACCVALDARFSISGPGGEREVPARGFFVAALQTILAPDEILTRISIPLCDPTARVAFRELARRHGDFAIAAVAVQHEPGGALSAAIGGVCATPFPCRGLQAGMTLADIDAYVAREQAALDPLADLHASGDYRRHVAGVLLGDALRDVLS